MPVERLKPISLLLVAAAWALLSGGCAGNGTPAASEQRRYSIWPPAPDLPRVQFLVSYQKSSDIQPARSRLDEIIYGREAELPIESPYGVAMRGGRIYVCDVRGRGLTVLDLKQQVTRVVGASGPGQIAKAVDVIIAPDGTKYVADGARLDIVVLDDQDRFVRRFSHPDFTPVGVAVYGDELFVTDQQAAQVKVLDRHTGQILRAFGERGVADGQFLRPLGVRATPDGRIIVSDPIKTEHIIQTFSRDGKLLHTMGDVGRRPGNFVRPKHMAIDSSGLLYVVDAAFGNVQIFDEQQKLLMYFGSMGSHPGAMDLPAGICISEDPDDIALFSRYIHPAFQAERLIIVTNQQGPNKVSVYAQGQLKAGRTLADISRGRAEMDTGTESGSAATGPLPPPITPDNAAPSAPSTQPAGDTAPAGLPQ